MLDSRTALQIQVRISAFSQFNNLLFAGEGQFLGERRPQIAFKELDVPSIATLEAGVNAVHVAEYSDGGESGL
jgi:hypothetical protein